MVQLSSLTLFLQTSPLLSAKFQFLNSCPLQQFLRNPLLVLHIKPFAVGGCLCCGRARRHQVTSLFTGYGASIPKRVPPLRLKGDDIDREGSAKNGTEIKNGRKVLHTQDNWSPQGYLRDTDLDSVGNVGRVLTKGFRARFEFGNTCRTRAVS